VRRTGKSYAHPLAVITVAKGLEETPRIGIVATRSLGNAVRRHRVKRQFRAIFASLLPTFERPVDLVVFARVPSASATFQEMTSAVQELLGKAGLVGRNYHGTGR
jgi:ribonuclease P protein component